MNFVRWERGCVLEADDIEAAALAGLLVEAEEHPKVSGACLAPQRLMSLIVTGRLPLLEEEPRCWVESLSQWRHQQASVLGIASSGRLEHDAEVAERAGRGDSAAIRYLVCGQLIETLTRQYSLLR